MCRILQYAAQLMTAERCLREEYEHSLYSLNCVRLRQQETIYLWYISVWYVSINARFLVLQHHYDESPTTFRLRGKYPIFGEYIYL